MRDIFKVINDIMNVVPAKEKDFREDLLRIEESAMYTAPEAMMSRWKQLSSIFSAYIPYPATEEWHDLAIDIFMDKKK